MICINIIRDYINSEFFFSYLYAIYEKVIIKYLVYIVASEIYKHNFEKKTLHV